MRYEIKGGAFPIVVCNLESGEQMITERGSMVWMSPNMQMETRGGGLGRMFAKAFAGESMFQNIYTARGTGMITFGSSFPGQIKAINIAPGQEMIVQKSAFLASEAGVELSVHFKKKLGVGLFGGEGFIMQRLSGNGVAFVEIDGELVEYAADFREIARNTLRNRWFIAVIAMGIVLFILGSIVEVGYSRFNLDLVDRQHEPEIGTLFGYFSFWKTTACARLLQVIYVLRWSLLFIIPGILASYSYAMTGYILAENPDLTASEAIEQSKSMMTGNRWRLFCLQVSFIGWDILCSLTFGIGYLWLNPYKYAATAAFYREISGTEQPAFNPPQDNGPVWTEN